MQGMDEGRAAIPGKGESASYVVLVIEDDVDCLDALVDVLSYDGYRVGTACNGLDAIQKLEAGPRPDVILVDLMMPVMNGWQFLKRLRADERFHTIPVIVLSADGRLDKWRDELDAAACLAKPLELEPLLAAVSRVLATAAADLARQRNREGAVHQDGRRERFTAASGGVETCSTKSAHLARREQGPVGTRRPGIAGRHRSHAVPFREGTFHGCSTRARALSHRGAWPATP